MKILTHIKHKLQGKLHGQTRSGKWHTIRIHYLNLFPFCAVCGGKEKLEVHHKKPFHLYPELELDMNNLITLCEAKRNGVNCHLFIGHLGNFRKINLSVTDDSKYWSKRIKEKVSSGAS